VPHFLLEQSLTGIAHLSLEELRRTADLFQVSLFCLFVQAQAILPMLIPANKIYMVSVNSLGLHRTGRKEPRCVACFVPQRLQQENLKFLHTYQRINRIQAINGGRLHPWSLVSFFEEANGHPRGKSGVHKEALICPNGKTIELESLHTALRSSTYVWTEATL
jgi:hypothetical protein